MFKLIPAKIRYVRKIKVTQYVFYMMEYYDMSVRHQVITRTNDELLSV